ncbi:hypothetical protein [Psychromonas ingrahamii]|uniref:hypothetical protein n=1 Tax=Psychromonas ingrahamii TaxID=357794 RepID=UPI000312A346|nr:hypothetical protein [Psychromonas ingrahamii]
MQKNMSNKQVNNELQEQALSEENKWELAVNKSKEKYKSAARRKDKMGGEKREYFKDTKAYGEVRGSDFDDYYS